MRPNVQPIDRICDLCGSRDYEVICQRDRRGAPLNTVACSHCGLVGHEKIPTEAELEAYYTGRYRLEYHGEARPSARRIWRAWLKGERVLNQLRPFLAPGARVFEVGAGLGCNVKVFDLAGYPASGLDPGTSFYRYATEKLHARILPCSLFEYQPSEPHDLLLLIHVIEHFRSPRLALEVMHRLLRPGGLLYLECPSLGKQFSDLSELFHFAHIHTFTPLTLIALARHTGFSLAHTFSDGHGVNHKFLFSKTEAKSQEIDPASYRQTKEFLQKYHQPSHRWQGDYLAGRMRRVSIYMKEFLWANWAVQGILRRCA